MIKIRLAELSFLMIFFIEMQSQSDTVFLMNGHMVCGEITDTANSTVTAFDCKRPGKKLRYESDEVFSFKKKDQAERFFYEEQPDNPDWFSRKDFKYYMQAERDARSMYKSKGAFWSGVGSGFICGATGSFFVSNLMKKFNSELDPTIPQLGVAFATPFLTLGITQLFKIKIRRSATSNIDNLGESAYIDGYDRQARSKRSLISLKGTFLGLGLGYGLYFLTNGSYLK
jgi:hypothetical protein